MALKVPQYLEKGLIELANLSGDSFDQLFQFLERTIPSLSPDFATQMASQIPQSEEEVHEILRVLVPLYNLGETSYHSIDDLVSDVQDSVKSFSQISDATILGQRLKQLLELDKTLGVMARASEVMNEQERLFWNGRIITDFRPIFSIDAHEIRATTVVHSLKIEYRQKGGSGSGESFFVAMDRRDLKELRAAVDRALNKEEALNAFAKKMKIPCLTAPASNEES